MATKFDLQWIIFNILGTVMERLLYSNYTLCLCACLFTIAYFISGWAFILAGLSIIFTLLRSFARCPCPFPLYKGKVDVLLGRSRMASSKTPDMPANNNVSIATFGDLTVLAYRKAETHFASPSAKIHVATSRDLENWDECWTYHTGKDDLREVLLFQMKKKLFLHFATLAPEKKGFAPRGMHWTSTENLKVWSEPVAMGRATEITWDIKMNQDIAYKVGYTGDHYSGNAICQVIFEKSTNGETWKPVGKNLEVYVGGISEVSFEFTNSGDLVAIGRNEDGDATGFGSQLFFAPKNDLGNWTALRVSIPYRFDSPRLVNMDGELMLFARYAREKFEAIPKWMPFGVQRLGNLMLYSTLPKSAAVYHITPPDKDGAWQDQPISLVRAFEDTFGDTGFFSVAHSPSGEWAVANYSSSCHSHAPWVYGQLYPTDVFVCRCMIAKDK